MPKISIIVPVYKVEKYLDRCIDSIINQTFTDYELILVDDGSPDNCGKMCDYWAKKDSRIVVIHKENGGLSDARNAGLDCIHGEYVTFVDSDDVIHNQTLEILYKEIKENNASIAFANDIDFKTYELPERFYNRISKYETEIFDCTTRVPEILFAAFPYINSACVKLYKSCIFNNLRFKKDIFCEDWQIKPYILTLNETKKIVHANVELYYYYCPENNNSLMRSKLNENKVKSLLEIYFEHYLFFKNNNYNIVAKVRADKLFISIVKLMVLSKTDSDLKPLFYKYYKKYYFKVLKTSSKYLSLKKKLVYISLIFTNKKYTNYIKRKFENELELKYSQNL